MVVFFNAEATISMHIKVNSMFLVQYLKKNGIKYTGTGNSTLKSFPVSSVWIQNPEMIYSNKPLKKCSFHNSIFLLKVKTNMVAMQTSEVIFQFNNNN
jgi:hypothetical protein